MDVSFRAVSAADEPFVESVYFETQRWIIEALFGWRGDDAEREKFRESYDADNTTIILVGGVAFGWWTVRRSATQMNLDALYLLASYQGHGIGSNLIWELIAEADKARVPIRLSTAKINPARRLYARLGFSLTHEDQFKAYFERLPA